jgi:hypothetical protein
MELKSVYLILDGGLEGRAWLGVDCFDRLWDYGQ